MMIVDPPPENAIPASLPSIDPKGAPTFQNAEAEPFYIEAIRELVGTGIPFLVAGTYALSAYTGNFATDEGSRYFLQGRRLPAHTPTKQTCLLLPVI